MINNIDIDKLKKIFVPKGEKFNQIVQSIINWANISGKPTVFPPETHNHDDIYLNKSNTDAYIPTSNYHPATKKYVDDNKVSVPLNKLDAVSPPTTSDDNTKGYSVGSFWVDEAHENIYQAVNVDTNSAIWKQLNSVINDDAPSDGKVYGRKNGNWMEFTGEGTAELIISNAVGLMKVTNFNLFTDINFISNDIVIV